MSKDKMQLLAVEASMASIFLSQVAYCDYQEEDATHAALMLWCDLPKALQIAMMRMVTGGDDPTGIDPVSVARGVGKMFAAMVDQTPYLRSE